MERSPTKRRWERGWGDLGHVEERPWWPIQSPNKGRKKKRKAKRTGRSDKVS